MNIKIKKVKSVKDHSTIKKTVKKAAKNKTTKRKSRKKKAVELKEKLMWAIYSPTMKHVENFEFHDKNSAEKRKEVLSKNGKSPHWIKRVRITIEEPIEEEDES